MCYSAQCWAAWRQYRKQFDAFISIEDFAELYGYKRLNRAVRTPKAMDAMFAEPASPEEAAVKAIIDGINAAEEKRLQEELFKQTRRLNDAQRALAGPKPTRKAQEDVRIAPAKIDAAKRKLGDLQRTELKNVDSRIFPGWYAPVMIVENGRRVVKPMRYQCRQAGKPAFYDTKYPGTYNARRDNLEKFWKGQFGHSHGIMVVNRFYENVSRHRVEGRELEAGEAEENVVLEFAPRPAHDMLVACLWSRWTPPAGSSDLPLLSFAAITDEPPREVAAAGHDRCIVSIKTQNLSAWLNPDPRNLRALCAILDDRDRPYYEHKRAA